LYLSNLLRSFRWELSYVTLIMETTGATGTKDLELLIFALKKGDDRAFDKIFTHFYSPLCFFANSVLNDRDAAEDVVQEVMLKFWDKRISFDVLESAKSFLYVSVRNSCFNLLDKEKVKTKYETYVKATDAFIEDNILQTIIRAETVRQVAGVLHTLPEQCRKVIQMTYQDELKPKEIADKLGITVSTVNNQKKRGLSLLKERMPGQDLSVVMLLLMLSCKGLV
jgi:RNA polymerase sigma-70 factor (family 1)